MSRISRAIGVLLVPQLLLGNSICICGSTWAPSPPSAKRSGCTHCCAHRSTDASAPRRHRHDPNCNHCGPGVHAVLVSESPALPLADSMTLLTALFSFTTGQPTLIGRSAWTGGDLPPP